MFEVVKDTYKLYVKKMPIWVLFVLCLIVYSATDDFFRDYLSDSRSYFYISMALSPLVFALVQLFIYKYVLKTEFGKFFGFIKKLISITAFQVAMGFVMMIPMFVFSRIIEHHNLVVFWVPLGLVANIFLGIWLLAKVSVILPMIVMEDKFSLAACHKLMKADYLSWALVAALIYFPYIASYYLIGNEMIRLLVSSLLSVLLPLFNSLYYQTKNSK